MRCEGTAAALVAALACYAFSSPVWAQPTPNADLGCSYDRDALLALDQQAFDQDMKGGWRRLAQREGCMEAAAALLREYREEHGLEAGILYWHEGQLRAMLGATGDAIELFKKSYDSKDTSSARAWNLYAAATIAFLQQNKSALLTAREALAGLPRPAGAPASMSWPMNLNVVDMLVACFGREYKEAYGQCKQ